MKKRAVEVETNQVAVEIQCSDTYESPVAPSGSFPSSSSNAVDLTIIRQSSALGIPLGNILPSTVATEITKKEIELAKCLQEKENNQLEIAKVSKRIRAMECILDPSSPQPVEYDLTKEIATCTVIFEGRDLNEVLQMLMQEKIGWVNNERPLYEKEVLIKSKLIYYSRYIDFLLPIIIFLNILSVLKALLR